MRDLICGGAILSWVFTAAHAGTGTIAHLFGMVEATLTQVLAHIG